MSSTRASLGMRVTAAVCVALLLPSPVVSSAAPLPQAQTTTTAAATIPNDQLDSLVAPIALYPDPLLAQVLAASTYPLEIIQLQQWLAKNPDLKGEALAAAVEKEDWDPAVQGLAALPDVVKRLADDIKWTNDLGNAFLAQQNDVMEAVQRMRKKASGTGSLKTTEQQTVTTQVVQTKEVIVIQQANPQVIYVPVYNPVVVYGPPIYPYPPIYYPPPGYYAAGVAIGFGVGIAMGAFWGGGWGYGPRWGYGSVNINVNNRHVSHYNRYNTSNRYGGSWNHNPAHRGGAPYGTVPVPIVRIAGQWYFDSRAGHDEILFRRVGTNELDALEVCRGYVEAQKEYALDVHGDSRVHQYAQRIISTPGTQDGLYWRNADGTDGGPISEVVARAIEEGYAVNTASAYHGYFFSVLKGQGPAAPLGELDYVIGDAMIGGFALIATPAEYGVTGAQTFIVNHDGIVYQKDLGPDSVALARQITCYNPDTTWTRTNDGWAK